MVLRAFQEMRHIARAETPTHRHLRDRIVAITVVTLGMWVLGAFLTFHFERHAQDTEIHTLGDSFFWVGAQLTSVSSSMRNPFTTGGRILDIVLELWSIVFVTSLAGAFGAFFVRRSHERDPITPPAS